MISWSCLPICKFWIQNLLLIKKIILARELIKVPNKCVFFVNLLAWRNLLWSAQYSQCRRYQPIRLPVLKIKKIPNVNQVQLSRAQVSDVPARKYNSKKVAILKKSHSNHVQLSNYNFMFNSQLTTWLCYIIYKHVLQSWSKVNARVNISIMLPLLQFSSAGNVRSQLLLNHQSDQCPLCWLTVFRYKEVSVPQFLSQLCR